MRIQNKRPIQIVVFLVAVVTLIAYSAQWSSSAPVRGGHPDDRALAAATPDAVPAEIQAIFDKPLYRGAKWGLRVLKEGQVQIDLRPNYPFFIGSVRKLFSVGQLLNQVGPKHTYNTPVFGVGTVDKAGVLRGNLVLVASGDLTMGGRTLPDGSVAFTTFDHNEADSLGNAELTAPDPLAGYKALAKQVKTSGIKEIKGDVVIDDRLFQPFKFREQFDVRPIYVNDDVVDATINPTTVGAPVSMSVRPISAALTVKNALVTGPPKSPSTLQLDTECPTCIGKAGCGVQIKGSLPVDFLPALNKQLPLVQNFRIVQPSNYARTVFIEALVAQGIKVDAATVAENPVGLLPSVGAYEATSRVAQLIGSPYSEYVRYILKVSYNIGADTSLVLYGLTQGVNNMTDALRVSHDNLVSQYAIPSDSVHFVDGSGGGETTATNFAVTQLLAAMSTRAHFPVFLNGLPSLGVDGSLGFIKGYKADPTLAGATGHVHAKPGTYALPTASGLIIKGQALAGYITTRSGKHIVYELVVNDVPVPGVPDILQMFEDEGKISAILWRDY